jgi:hypothetical protein
MMEMMELVEGTGSLPQPLPNNSFFTNRTDMKGKRLVPNFTAPWGRNQGWVPKFIDYFWAKGHTLSQVSSSQINDMTNALITEYLKNTFTNMKKAYGEQQKAALLAGEEGEVGGGTPGGSKTPRNCQNQRKIAVCLLLIISWIRLIEVLESQGAPGRCSRR